MKKNEQDMQHMERCIQGFGGETGEKEIICKT